MEKRPVGRPRAFDPQAALERAMVVFWEQGYDGASLSDLTDAMGVSRKSMYLAFGNKEELFRLVLDLYTAGPGSYVLTALECSTSRDVAESFLLGSVRATTRPDGPHGCLGVQGALAVGRSGAAAQALLTAWRESGVTLLRDRLQRAVDERDLPVDADPALLARYLMTVANGIAVQAASGVVGDELTEVAEAALCSWPTAGRQRTSTAAGGTPAADLSPALPDS